LVKICGITNEADLETALEAGADYIGIVREPSSPRYVENPMEMARLAAGRAAVIGVYGEYYEDEKVQVFDSIQTISSPILANVLRTVRLGKEGVDNVVDELSCPILLDAYSPFHFGGGGETVDWDIAQVIVQNYTFPVFLAGGLDPENVAEAIHKVSPFAVDVSSGVESAPGRKDHVKVRAFIEAAHSV
jgi:phosphoribosylanthranilate isomerase